MNNKRMKLVVVFADTNSALHVLHGIGEVVQSPKRRVEIELTEGQIKALKSRDAGYSGGQIITEDILTMFFEEMD